MAGAAVSWSRPSPGSLGWRFERGDGDMHPLVQRQRPEHAVELAFAVGAVQPDGPGLAASDGPLPDPDEMPIISQSARRGCLGGVASLDLRRRSPLRNVDLELNQEFHGLSSQGCPHHAVAQFDAQWLPLTAAWSWTG